VLYRLDGGSRAPERTIGLDGYRGSSPVRIGNGAVDQLQLDIYGDLFEMVWMHVDAGGTIDPDIGHRLAATADLVCDIWRQPDAGLWEVRSEPQQFTQSKMKCAIALDRAVRLAERGAIRSKGLERWRAEAAAIRRFVNTSCWSEAKQTYVRFSGSDELDASLLLGCLFNFADRRDIRMSATVSAIARELSNGPFVYRYTGQDGLAGNEGAFLTCSFWLADALARCDRREEAARLFEQLLGYANDVGLYAEQIDPASGMFLGNFPQGLTHLALIGASITLGEE
jgi:GH15 family glucan-1,4-alpha-glucosidase